MPTRDTGFAPAYWLSGTLAVLLLVAAAGGLFVPGLYRDTPLWAAQARGVNLVDLVIALPTLVVSVLLSARGSRRATLVWLAVLGYVLYNEVILAFDIAFNALFLVYVALLSLSVFSLIAVLVRLDVADLQSQFSAGTPVRSVSVYLLVVAALFFLAWMKDIVPAILTNTVPAAIIETRIPTNPVYVLDLGFLIPLYILGVAWLLNRRAGGYLLVGLLLGLNTLLSLSIISSTLFQHAADHSVSLAIVPVFGVIALASIALATWFVSSLTARPATKGVAIQATVR